jgi:SNF2 family DNA or RNA helicase
MSTLLPISLPPSSYHEYNIDIDEIQDSDPRAQQPECGVTLKPHQLSLLHRCMEYESNPISLARFHSLQPFVKPGHYFKTNMGIIADRVGSGKSYVMLSLCLNDITESRDNTIVVSTGLHNVAYYFTDDTRAIKTNLIVIPHNLSSQWEQYVKNFGAIKNFKIINRTKVLDQFLTDVDNVEKYDLIIVTATYFRRVVGVYIDRKVRLHRIFFDEVDSLNTAGCLNVPAKFLWFVTASYGNILYPRGFNKYDPSTGTYINFAHGIRHSGFVRHMFQDLSTFPRMLWKTLVVKNSEAFIESSMHLPEMVFTTIKCRTPYAINILNGIVDRNVIESLNAGDVEGAISFISASNRGSQENIVDILLEKMNNQLKNFELHKTMIGGLMYDDERERATDLANLNKKIDDMKNKMEEMRKRMQASVMCSICYDDIQNQTIAPCCQNSYCFKCIQTWLSKGRDACPMCKSVLRSSMLYVVDNNASAIVTPEVPPQDVLNDDFDKLQNLEILLKNKFSSAGHKVLIFTSSENFMQQVMHALRRISKPFEIIRGNGDQVNAIMKRYKSNALDVLLVNSNNAGVGLNLENTTDIIMMQKFDTQLEAQIIGRAQRLGRQTPLNVYYLLHENEIRR